MTKLLRIFGPHAGHLNKSTRYVLSMLTLFLATNAAFAQLRPNLGTASTYAVFTGSGAIINTGLTALTGDVGQDGAYAFNGFPPGTYTGALNRNNGASALAKSDLLSAWTTEAAVTDNYVLGVGIVNGQSFDPAVYHSGAASTTTGNITFDAHGNANAIFIVKIGGQLDANAGTHILLANNARAANIYWFVDGAVNIAANSSFKGTIFARGAISFAGTSSLDGRALVAPGGAINLTANNMAVSTDTVVANNLTVVRPALRDSIRGGSLNYQITWTGTGIASMKTLQYSLDSGLTWLTIGTMTADVLTYNWNVPDTISKKALVRITDANNLRGVSGLFTITSSKIIVTNPALAEIITGATQNYQITWTGTGLASRKIFEVSLDSGLTWKTIDTISANVFTHSWNVPDTISTKAVIRITDSNGITGKSGAFTIKSSKITVIRPALAEIITGGKQNYQITWAGLGLTTQKTFDLSLDGGLTWKTIGTLSADIFTYTWNVPDTVSTQAVIRITDASGITGKSGVFTIKSSKIIVVRPALGEIITGGTRNYQITWTGIGLAAQKSLELSLDGGRTWQTIAIVSSDALTYNWNVPETVSTQAVIRITDAIGITGKSGAFTIKSGPKIIVVQPAPGEIIASSTPNYQITWTGAGITTQKTFELSLNGGLTWKTIGTISADVFSYNWNVPDTTSTQAVIRITDNNGLTGRSGVFTIKSSITPILGSIVVTHPLAGEEILGGYLNFPINFTAVNTTTQKTFEYSLDGGATWTTIGSMNSNAQTYPWASVPNIATTKALIRITDANGVTGTSPLFTITICPTLGSIDAVTLSELDSKNNIGNNKTLGISWTYTPDIGTSVEVEYSLDYMVTWSHIASVPVSGSPNTTSWLTTATGYYNPVFIRVTSTKGMTRTSAAFSIGARLAGVSDPRVLGYSLSNYPNPASSETTINFTLPVSGDATLIVSDAVGRELMNIESKNLSAGTHTVHFNAAGLASGAYTYRLLAGGVMLTGKMDIVR